MQYTKISLRVAIIAAQISVASCSDKSPPFETQPPTAAEFLTYSCSGCHHSANTHIPDYRALDFEALKDALHGYKSDIDGQTVMHRIMRGYTDDEIDLIANYLGVAP